MLPPSGQELQLWEILSIPTLPFGSLPPFLLPSAIPPTDGSHPLLPFHIQRAGSCHNHGKSTWLLSLALPLPQSLHSPSQSLHSPSQSLSAPFCSSTRPIASHSLPPYPSPAMAFSHSSGLAATIMAHSAISNGPDHSRSKLITWITHLNPLPQVLACVPIPLATLPVNSTFYSSIAVTAANSPGCYSLLSHSLDHYPIYPPNRFPFPLTPYPSLAMASGHNSGLTTVIVAHPTASNGLDHSRLKSLTWITNPDPYFGPYSRTLSLSYGTLQLVTVKGPCDYGMFFSHLGKLALSMSLVCHTTLV